MTLASTTADAIVIGGGPAGSMVAIHLAAARRRVVLVEREPAAHHKVCGEFLSREAVHYLCQVSVSPLDLGGTGIGNVRLSSGNTVVVSPLPFRALSLSRSALDEALLSRAGESGCHIMPGSAVESLTARDNIWVAALSNGVTVCAQAVFLATGKHDLRGWSRPRGKQNDLIGFKLHFKLAAAQAETLRDYMDLYLFPGGYGGLSLIENDTANLCLVVRRSVLRGLGAWPQLLPAIVASNSHLRQLLHSAEPLWNRPLAISPIPYGYLATESRGPWCVGDQAAVIPSFTGDGISIALHSATLAAQMFLAGCTASEFHRALYAQLRRPMAVATALSRAAVTNPGRILAPLGASLVPSIMRFIATSTRIPSQWLLRGDELLTTRHALPPQTSNISA
jgi:menaquinone-9 beta-reductase